jgi:hypothetical protein
MNMRSIWIAAFAMALSGCGTVASTKLDIASHQPPTFELVDERPAEVRVTRKSSGPEGEVTSLGDDGINPAGPKLLQSWLSHHFSSRIAGRQLILQEFSVEITDPTVSVDNQGFSTAVASTPGADPLSAMLAYWLIVGVERIKSEKYVGVRISGKLGDNSFTSRGDGNFKGRVSETDINSVITQALELATTQIDIFLKTEEESMAKQQPMLTSDSQKVSN